MKTRSLACAATLLGSLFIPALSGQTPAPDASPAPAQTAASSVEEAIKADLTALVERIKTKLKAGPASEAALTDELRAFDELSAKYAADKSDAAAMIGLMKAGLYLQVLENTSAGLAQLRLVAQNFPDTQTAARIPEMIAGIEQAAAAEAATAVGQPFAPFKETATDGTTLDLAAYKGKVVLVDFWATWCGPCVQELPHVLAAYEKYHDKGFEIIGVSLDKDAGRLADFTRENKMPWPQFFDGQGWQNKLAQAYGIHSIPATFLLDGEGRIVAKGLRGDLLSQKIGELLGAAH